MIEQFYFQLPTDAHLRRKRSVRIFRPSFTTADQALPVLYMHDGQNVFGGATATFGEGWEIDRIIETLRLPIMIVATACSPDWVERYDEYSYYQDEVFLKRVGPEEAKKRGQIGGKGKLYADWLMRELKPWVDDRYATKADDIGVMGSSMGGVISLYLMADFPEIKRIGALSTAAWSNRQSLLTTLGPVSLSGRRLYMDIGTQEESGPMTPSDYLESNADIVKLLATKPGCFRYEIEEGAVHNEIAWRRRLPEALRFLYPDLV